MKGHSLVYQHRIHWWKNKIPPLTCTPVKFCFLISSCMWPIWRSHFLLFASPDGLYIALLPASGKRDDILLEEPVVLSLILWFQLDTRVIKRPMKTFSAVVLRRGWMVVPPQDDDKQELTLRPNHENWPVSELNIYLHRQCSTVWTLHKWQHLLKMNHTMMEWCPEDQWFLLSVEWLDPKG